MFSYTSLWIIQCQCNDRRCCAHKIHSFQFSQSVEILYFSIERSWEELEEFPNLWVCVVFDVCVCMRALDLAEMVSHILRFSIFVIMLR